MHLLPFLFLTLILLAERGDPGPRDAEHAAVLPAGRAAVPRGDGPPVSVRAGGRDGRKGGLGPQVPGTGRFRPGALFGRRLQHPRLLRRGHQGSAAGKYLRYFYGYIVSQK